MLTDDQRHPAHDELMEVFYSVLRCAATLRELIEKNANWHKMPEQSMIARLQAAQAELSDALQSASSARLIIRAAEFDRSTKETG